MSPELLDPGSFGLEKSYPTRESDRYALGMVIYEVLSGRAPFAPHKAPVLKILRGERPERPQGCARGVVHRWYMGVVGTLLETSTG
jgi:serine/threonine protein kinase